MAPNEVSNHQAQIIRPPNRPDFLHPTSIFLSGTTTPPAGGGPGWRDKLFADLSSHAVTIIDPTCSAWDSTWRQESSFAPFRQQVEWEIDMLRRADLVAVLFGAETDAPISLLELGICLGSRKPGTTVVACLPGYKKAGNVEITCERIGGVVLVRSEQELEAAILKMVADRVKKAYSSTKVN